MTKLPTDLSGKELVKILEKVSFVFHRQGAVTWCFDENHPLPAL
jgi:hypothetical protein